MQLSDFTYNLPKDAIAQQPPTKRGEARLLVLKKDSGRMHDNNYADVVNYLEAGDVVVLNDTKVIKARLFAQDDGGEEFELVLLERHGKTQDRHHHKVLYRGKLQAGMELYVGDHILKVIEIQTGGIAHIESEYDLDILAEQCGNVPLPPYMRRAATKKDVARYQTEFAKAQGSVAAPTASLNMTLELIEQIKAKGVIVCYLTLHVGLGTFLPIRVDDLEKHTMHSEYFEIGAKTVAAIAQAKSKGKKVMAVGTTVARTLEYCSDQILRAAKQGTQSLPRTRYGDDRQESLDGEADIFIYPGYEFRIVDKLLTNFHAPGSTVLMLAAAFAGWDNLVHAYDHALNNHYQFLSYGDSMLIV